MGCSAAATAAACPESPGHAARGPPTLLPQHAAGGRTTGGAGAGLLLPPRMERPARLRGLSAPNTHANQVSVYERSIFERVVTPGQPGLSALGHAPHY